jgi:hypothetical protein
LFSRSSLASSNLSLTSSSRIFKSELSSWSWLISDRSLTIVALFSYKITHISN